MTVAHLVHNANLRNAGTAKRSFFNERLSHSNMRNRKSGLCCGDGKIKVRTVPEPPEPLATLLTDTSSQRSRLFWRNIRRYNCALSTASMRPMKSVKGLSVFKVHGENHRFISPMHYSKKQQPKCLQTFFASSASLSLVATLQRCVLRPQAELKPEGPKIKAAGR